MKTIVAGRLGGDSRPVRRSWAVLGVGCLAAAVAVAADRGSPAPTAGPDEARQLQLVRMVRQDCGSCHGMRLTGGLGPALTREALSGWPLDSLTAVILFGRPGTPMPGWRSMISEDDAQWMARRLLAGFPDETPAPGARQASP